MSLFDVFTMLGGLSFFIFGMGIMTQGLENIAGGKLEVSLKRMTETPLKGIMLGTAVTAAVQSSSAITVMLVGFVNSGLIPLRSSIGVIMGSNIGTTLTSWILSISGIESNSFIVKLFQPSSLMPLFALLGVTLSMATKNDRLKNSGSVLMGFALLVYGMELMSSASLPLTKAEGYTKIINLLKNPLIGLIAGTVITGIVQSSAATVGILQALSTAGGISYATALPIIMGQNIGTCVTALISSIGTSKNAKRVAVIHINFNIIGTVFFLAVYLIGDAVFNFSFSQKNVTPMGIAAIHTVFNILSTVLLYPFISLLEKSAFIAVKENSKMKGK